MTAAETLFLFQPPFHLVWPPPHPNLPTLYVLADCLGISDLNTDSLAVAPKHMMANSLVFMPPEGQL